MNMYRFTHLIILSCAIKLYAVFWLLYLVFFIITLSVCYILGKGEILSIMVKWGFWMGMVGVAIYVVSGYFFFFKQILLSVMSFKKRRAKNRSA